MPKDNKKNRYFQIGVAWDSWTLKQLEADAALHQMDDQTSKLIVLRLTEYYKLVERGIIIPGITAMMQQQVVPNNGHSNGHAAAPMTPSSTKRGGTAAVPVVVPEPEEEPQSTVTESDSADENADAAFDFFKMDDEDE